MKRLVVLAALAIGCGGMTPAGDDGVDAAFGCAEGRRFVNGFCELDPSAMFRIATRGIGLPSGERAGDAWSVCIGTSCTGPFRRRDATAFVSTEILGPMPSSALMPLVATIRHDGTGASCVVTFPWRDLNLFVSNESAAQCMLSGSDPRQVQLSILLRSP